MVIRQWFLINGTDEIKLPVPPNKYSITEKINTGIIDLLNYGEIDTEGTKALFKTTISSHFPATMRSYYQGTDFLNATELVNKIRSWQNDNAVINLIITGTEVAKTVKITSFTWGEEDGTGDIYYSMDLQEHREIGDISSVDSSSSADTYYELPVGSYRYYVDEGDTLIKIAKWYYGDSSKWTDIATRNNLKNPNDIKVGQVMYI